MYITQVKIFKVRISRDLGHLDNLAFCVRQGVQKTRMKKKVKMLAERGFDPRTSGLWAQHASTAPLCFRRKSF